MPPGSVAAVVGSENGQSRMPSGQLHPFFSTRRRQTWEEQLGSTSAVDNFDRINPENLPRIEHQGKRYIREHHLGSKSKKRSRSSWIFNHGIAIVEVSPDFNVKGLPFWLCRYCDRESRWYIAQINATSASIMHLARKHKVYAPSEESTETGDDESPASSQGHSITNVLDLQVKPLPSIVIHLLTCVF